MEDNYQYIKLDKVVSYYLDQSQTPESGRFRIWNLAVRCINQLAKEFSLYPKTVKLGVLPNKTVQMPLDYFKWLKVGVMNEQGEIATLKYNKDLTTLSSDYDERLTNISPSYITEYTKRNVEVYRNYFYNDFCYHLFGIPAGTTYLGGFTIDKANSVIVLSPDFMFDNIILEYVSIPTPNSDYMIPSEFVETIISWCGWKDIEFSPSGRRANISEKEMRRKMFRTNKRHAINIMSDIKLSDLTEIIRQGSRLSIKS